MNSGSLSAQQTALVEAIASRVVELLSLPQPVQPPRRLLSAAELAGELGVGRSFVYQHADELGAVRLGEGSKPRLRFDPERARSAVFCSESGRSQGESASGDGESGSSGGRGRRRLPSRLPKPGSVLAIRGQETQP